MAKKARLTDRDTGYAAVMKLLKGMGGQIEAGFVAGLSSEESVMKAYLNETGAGNRPVRQFIGPAFDSVRYKVAGVISGAAAKEIRKKPKSTSQATRNILRTAARLEAEAIQNFIMAFDSPGNAPSTIRQKGFDNPLIETQEMLENVSYQVRDGRGRFLVQEKMR